MQLLRNLSRRPGGTGKLVNALDRDAGVIVRSREVDPVVCRVRFNTVHVAPTEHLHVEGGKPSGINRIEHGVA